MNTNLYNSENKNRLNISKFQKFEGGTQFNQVAAKFVVSGEETYIIKGKKYIIKKGEYIIGNAGQLSEVIMKELTVGLCLDVSYEIIKEVAKLYFDQKDFLVFLLEDNFLINKYKTENTSLGIKLNALAATITNNKNKLDDSILNDELFLSLGESIVLDQSKVFKEFSQLNFKKHIVNEDNYRKLLNSKNYIDEHYLEDIKIDNLLSLACMSKFNFIRLFKLTFGLSPYQYIITQRLQHAKKLILHGKKISEVAYISGFADIASFSKAFKHQYSVAPSKLL